MPIMSGSEGAFCRGRFWRHLSTKVLLRGVVRGVEVTGDVLEIGAGAGATADVLLDRHPDITLVATDLDPEMVAAAGDLLARHGGRASAQVADATQLPFDDDRFDTVLSGLMLHHVVEWEAAIAEVARVLRPGGRLVGYDLTANRGARLMHGADRPEHRLLDPDELRACLLAAGFEDPVLKLSGFGLLMRFEASLGSLGSCR